MINKRIISGGLVLAGLFPLMASADVQTITASPASFNNVHVGDTVNFTVKYPASNPNATGLGLKIYFDSSKLTLGGYTNILPDNKLSDSVSDDSSNGDGDASTDKFINIAWVNFSGSWPAQGKDLVTVTYTASAGFTSNTQINFTGEPSAGNTFSSTPIPVKLATGGGGDTTPPVVTAPADITKEATGSTTPVNLGTGTAIDDTDGVLTPTASPVGPFTVGTHTVTWSATDAAGNVGTDTQKVTITDTTPPVISVRDITKQSTGATTAVNLGATATDLVDGAITPTTTDSTGPFSVGVHTIKWTAVDAAGNFSTKTQKVTITEKSVDRQPPVILIPVSVRDLTIIIPRGSDKIRLADINFGVRATDNVGVVKLEIISIENADLPEFLSPGDYIITWRATDAAGNEATGTQRLSVRAADATDIPTLSEWGIILLSVLLGLVSLTGFGRKKNIQ